ncbi:hypothetical protein GCM10010208_04430 [Actinomadura livida]|nr:hypothetical protein GCM10010208_04430 [Actinomadura livida]
MEFARPEEDAFPVHDERVAVVADVMGVGLGGTGGSGDGEERGGGEGGGGEGGGDDGESAHGAHGGRPLQRDGPPRCRRGGPGCQRVREKVLRRVSPVKTR